MFQKIRIPLTIASLAAASVFAAEGDHVSIYSGGVSLGGAAVLTDSASRAADAYGVLGLNNRFTINDHFDITADAEWYGFSSSSFGVTAGFDWKILHGKVSPFVGVGGGFSWYDHGHDFDDGFGLSGRAHAGVQFDLTDNMGVTFSVPYRFTANDQKDQTIGFQFGMLFFSAQKNIKKIM